MNITTIGIDLAKNVFQVHGTDARGKAVLRKALTPLADGAVFRAAAAVLNRHGGMRQCAFLGPQAHRLWVTRSS